MIEAEGLPNVAALLRNGASGRLIACSPKVGAAQWTSMITGKRAHKHGLLHTQRPMAAPGQGTGPAGRETVRCATLGAILSANGLSIHQIGWPVSHPVERLRGVTVSDRFATEGQSASIASTGGWPWVQPASAAAHLFERRFAPAEVEEITLAELLPSGLLAPQLDLELREALRELIAESLTLFRAIKWCAGISEWDCIVGAFPSLLRCREILSQRLPQAEFNKERQRILRGCYEHLDMLLGQLVASAGDEAVVILTSVGKSDTVDPMLTISGSVIQGGVLPNKASVLDVTPTVLSLLGISVGQDMDGSAWTSLIDPRVTSNSVLPEQIETWDICVHAPAESETELTGTPDREESDAVADPAIRHLVELGYEDPLETALRERIDQCRCETERNRALSLLEANQADEAIELLQSLKTNHSDWLFPYDLLADIYTQSNQSDLADQELEYLIHRGAESARLYLFLGRIAAIRRDFETAVSHFHVAGQINERLRGLDQAKGIALLKRRAYSEASEKLLSALEIDGPSAQIYDQLATCRLGLGKSEEAAEFALAAIDEDMHYGFAHYHLAIALVRLGRFEDAKRAFEVSTLLEPSHVAPLRWLARLAADHLSEPEQANEYLERGRGIIRSRRSGQADRADDTSKA